MVMGKLWSGFATVLALALFLLAVAVTIMSFQNRELQSEVNQRQQIISQAAQFSQINQALVRSLAAASIKNTEIKQLLAKAGINVTYHPDPNPPSSADTPNVTTTNTAGPDPMRPSLSNSAR